MEKILEIKEVDDKDGGYIVITDKQKIEILIQNTQYCCESWGWFASEDNPQDFVGTNLINIFRVNESFDPKEVEGLHLDAGEAMFINIETDIGVLQFTLYNAHNGYYGHSVTIKSKQLTLDDVL